jgi:hypothetical protein
MDHMVARASIKEQDMAAAAAAATVTANHSTDTTREELEARLTVAEAVITIHMAQHKELNRSKWVRWFVVGLSVDPLNPFWVGTGHLLLWRLEVFDAILRVDDYGWAHNYRLSLSVSFPIILTGRTGRRWKQRQEREKESGASGAQQKRVLMGGFLLRVPSHLLLSLWWRLFVPDDIRSYGSYVWLWNIELEDMEKSTGDRSFHQDLTAILLGVFLSIDVDHATRGIFAVR